MDHGFCLALKVINKFCVLASHTKLVLTRLKTHCTVAHYTVTRLILRTFGQSKRCSMGTSMVFPWVRGRDFETWPSMLTSASSVRASMPRPLVPVKPKKPKHCERMCCKKSTNWEPEATSAQAKKAQETQGRRNQYKTGRIIRNYIQ